MHNALLIDTNIIVDCLRNNAAAVDYLAKSKEPFLMSVITVAELFSGIRNEKEKSILESFLVDFVVVPIDQDIAQAGGILCEEYRKSHGTDLADALIAATAQHHEATLVTLNTRHFPMVKTIKPYDKRM